MANQYSVNNGGSALVAATAKTLVEITTTSTQEARIKQLQVSFNDSSAAAGTKVELVTYTGASTGTAYTPKKYNADAQGRAANTSAKINDSVEPTTPTVLDVWYLPNTAGLFMQWPLGCELYIPISTIFGVRVTAAGTPTTAVTLIFEE